jgi:hypothetical protein
MLLTQAYRRGRAEGPTAPTAIPLPPAKLPHFCNGHLRKQWEKTRLRAYGRVCLAGIEITVEAVALIDDNAGYNPRRTLWQWCGGAGEDSLGRAVVWSPIVGLNDSPQNSERIIWVEGRPLEVATVRFAGDLSAGRFDSGETLHFKAEAMRQRSDNLLLIRSAYGQPFGVFPVACPAALTCARDSESWNGTRQHGNE